MHFSLPDQNEEFSLLNQLHEDLPEFLDSFVLPALDPTTLALLARTGKGWCATVVSSGLPHAGSAPNLELSLKACCESVELLAWAKANGCPWNEKTCALIAKAGHLDVLQWARGHGCPWDKKACHAAARGGHLDVLMWVREQGCPWNEKTCHAAAAGGHLGVLQWARSQDPPCPWDVRNVLNHAAASGHLGVLQWAREQGCPWDELTCATAAFGGHLDVLMWARQHGCPWDARTCDNAALGGVIEMFEWKQEHIAQGGTITGLMAPDTEILSWAQKHECLWDEETPADSARAGHLETIKWARKHGCPWTNRQTLNPIRRVFLAVLQHYYKDQES
jgi:hypothetical protein